MNGPEERCTVGLWRGYVSALFYARPVERDVALLVSPTFRTWQLPWRKRVALCDDPAAKESLRALEEMLAARGWEKMRPGAGADWYVLQFRRNEHADAHRTEPSAARSNGVRSRARLAQPGRTRRPPLPHGHLRRRAITGHERRPHLPKQRPQLSDRAPLAVAEHRERSERELRLCQLSMSALRVGHATSS